MPDFRASEVSFQLLTQVAGRAGRGEQVGEVYIQTFNPQNSILKYALSQDFVSFYHHEISSRELFHFAPFIHLVKIVFKGKNEEKTLEIAAEYASKLEKLTEGICEVHQPHPCGYPKIKENYRFQILVKTPSIYQLCSSLEKVHPHFFNRREVRILIDIDPSSTFF
jgi:primosomal protein N' (replication factor Y)